MKNQQVKKFIHKDSRGGLKKLYDIPESFKIRQIIISETKKAWTVRGLHYSPEPNIESKIITCIQGSVIWVALEKIEDGIFKLFTKKLEANTNEFIIIPRGRIHGCIMCEDDTLIQIVSDNDHDGNKSIHYEWGPILDEICKNYNLHRNALWESEKDVGYKRYNLGVNQIIK